jgi:hypothetical protein
MKEKKYVRSSWGGWKKGKKQGERVEGKKNNK